MLMETARKVHSEKSPSPFCALNSLLQRQFLETISKEIGTVC